MRLIVLPRYVGNASPLSKIASITRHTHTRATITSDTHAANIYTQTSGVQHQRRIYHPGKLAAAVYARPPYRPWVRPRAQLSLPGRCFVTGHFKHRSQRELVPTPMTRSRPKRQIATRRVQSRCCASVEIEREEGREGYRVE